ncbi:MAG: RnfABCDGE type electron transport complex subunit D [Clostridia bacterium]|nr:RnfABCDGE type electron transport complex subunit D [Clostridia bacterium]
MSQKFTVSASPHFHCGENTTKLMADVLIALFPAVIMSVVLFGWHSLVLIAISVASCMGFEYLTRRLLGRPNSLGDLSAVVTGVLLAMNLPSTVPWWLPIIGAFVAIVVVKQFFGGIGQNFVNPALVGRITLMVSFPQYMTAAPWKIPTVDAVTSATPLSLLANGEVPSLSEMLSGSTSCDPLSMFLGLRPGSLGETCIAALLLGGIYLCVRKVISPVIPLLFMGTTVAVTWIFGQNPYYNLMSGGLVLGALFMATDYTTCPINLKGKILYAIGCGFITAVIRLWGGMPEGVSVAIVLMNILVPHIERITTPKPFGYVKEPKEKEGAV